MICADVQWDFELILRVDIPVTDLFCQKLHRIAFHVYFYASGGVSCFLYLLWWWFRKVDADRHFVICSSPQQKKKKGMDDLPTIQHVC